MYYYERSSALKLMIMIWYYSMHRRILIDKNKYQYRYYINSCLISAKKRWNHNYIDFDIASLHFRSLKKELLDKMALKDEKLKEKLVDKYLRTKKIIN